MVRVSECTYGELKKLLKLLSSLLLLRTNRQMIPQYWAHKLFWFLLLDDFIGVPRILGCLGTCKLVCFLKEMMPITSTRVIENGFITLILIAKLISEPER